MAFNRMEFDSDYERVMQGRFRFNDDDDSFEFLSQDDVEAGPSTMPVMPGAAQPQVQVSNLIAIA